MPSLDSLPADQRAVLQLVLQRGRSYDDIAAMLSIDRAAVRQRALDGLDALGPGNTIAAPQRALVTDYLLGQLPPRVADQVRERLASSPPDRAWARVVASEISPLASSALPEIPAAATRRPAPAPEASQEPAREHREERSRPERSRPVGSGAAPREARAEESSPGPSRGSLAPQSSRRGGAILLGLIALAAVIVVIVVLATSGGGKKHHRGTLAAGSPTTGTAPTTSTSGAGTPTTGTTTTGGAKILNQLNLKSPTGTKAAGVVFVIREASTVGIVLKASNMPATGTHSAYAVWLTNPGGGSELVGYVNQKVTSGGVLETQGPLKADATKYSQMVVALQTPSQLKAPGQIVLEGSFSETKH